MNVPLGLGTLATSPGETWRLRCCGRMAIPSLLLICCLGSCKDARPQGKIDCSALLPPGSLDGRWYGVWIATDRRASFVAIEYRSQKVGLTEEDHQRLRVELVGSGGGSRHDVTYDAIEDTVWLDGVSRHLGGSEIAVVLWRGGEPRLEIVPGPSLARQFGKSKELRPEKMTEKKEYTPEGQVVVRRRVPLSPWGPSPAETEAIKQVLTALLAREGRDANEAGLPR